MAETTECATISGAQAQCDGRSLSSQCWHGWCRGYFHSPGFQRVCAYSVCPRAAVGFAWAMRRKLRILVADDNPTELELLRQAVDRDRLPVDIHEVHDGEEATHYLAGVGKFSDRKEHPFPDLLLVDLKMPKMDGVEVVKWLNTRPECCNLPVVMLSGSGLEKDVKKAYREGVNTYFSKPGEFKQFQRLIRTLVDYWGMSELPEMPHKC